MSRICCTWRLLIHPDVLEKHVFLATEEVACPMQLPLPSHLSEHLSPRLNFDWSSCTFDALGLILLLGMLLFLRRTSPTIEQQIIDLIHEQQLPSFQVLEVACHEILRQLLKLVGLLMISIEQVNVEYRPKEVIDAVPTLIPSFHKQALLSCFFLFLQIL